ARSGTESGYASYYADKYEGRKTSNGEVFRQRKLTAAHKTLPFGTKVKVTNLANGRTVRVRINDRGPFIEGRIIDLSKAAAQKVDMIPAGVTRVRIRY
ncbi:MAG: septal ring lytic transglycosylase RlpA family protein, partial [Sediminibacterium sp.]|nr:septal ring lytic transglycosylase RlpA family protein [Sediminibacterium sp.]